MKLTNSENGYIDVADTEDYIVICPDENLPLGEYGAREAAIRGEIVRRVNAHDQLVAALESSRELFEKALPKFNWESSFLNAEAITLLNDVPIEVAKALAEASEARTETTPDAKTGINEKDTQ